MTDDIRVEAAFSSDLATFITETPWQTALASRAGTLLALSRPLLELLHASADTMIGVPIELLAPEGERGVIAARFNELRHRTAPSACRVHLMRRDGLAMAVEIELFPIVDDRDQRVAVVVHPISVLHRREQIILEFNRLVPQLLEARSADDLYAKVTRSLEPLGMGILVTALEPDQAALRIEYAGPQSLLANLLRRIAKLDLDRVRIPRSAPYFSAVLDHRAAVFGNDFRALLKAVISPGSAAVAYGLQQLSGIPGFIVAPLLAHTQVRGVLMVWSHVLNSEHVPFVEAFAHQLAAVQAQIELRAQMRLHMQRLDSLAATGHAVTTLGSLDDVLRVVCAQAQELLGAELARIAAPQEGDGALRYIMSTGLQAPQLEQIVIPVSGSISGDVLRSGHGRVVEDLRQDSDIYAPFRAHSPARSVLYQALRHQGQALGVLIVGHSRAGYFSHADLEYAARYAEYASVAIANAQLHAALKRSELEQQRQRRELEVLLRVSQAVNSSLDLDTIMQAGLGAIEELGLATTSAVILLSGERLGAVSRVRHDVSPALLAAHNLILGDPQIVDDICNGRLVRISNAEFQAYLRDKPYSQALPWFSAILIPLVADGDTLGSLKLGRAGGEEYAERYVELLQAIAAQLAQAIARANVHTTLHAAVQDKARLYREADEARSYLNALVRNTPDLLLTIHQDMIAHVLNPERLGATGRYTSASIEGHSFLDLAPAHMHDHLLNIWRQVLSGRAQSFELELAKADGTPLFMLFSAALIADYGEVFVIVKDVTEQRQHEAYMRRNEKLAALGGLVAGAAHELNNPLAAILGLAQLQLGAGHDGELRADLEQIEQAALRAGSIVQQLVQFANLELPQPLLLAIAQPLGATLARLAHSLHSAAIQVSVDLAPKLPLINGDAHQLEHLFYNLLHNAVQVLAQAPQGQPRTIAIHAHQKGMMLHISLADSGPGIAPEHLSRIFDPFFTTRVVGQGAGLGLAISHAIVQQHGGRIWAHSRPGRGATFIIELPISEPS